MKKAMFFILIISFFLNACGAVALKDTNATPTMSPEDVKSTADAMVSEMMTQTQAALPPTNTMPPPTLAVTFTTIPTLTPVATNTAMPVSTQTSIPISTNTSISSSSVSCTDQQLTSWTGESVNILVTNNVKNSTANVFLCITTIGDEVGYLNIPVGSSGSIMAPQGCYHATAWVSGKRNFNATTTFCLKNNKPMRLIIDKNKLTLHSSCAPDC